MESVMRYSARATAFDKDRVWWLDETGLAWEENGTSNRFDYDKITCIRLEWAPTRIESNRYLCHVSIKSGWVETIPSMHFVGLLKFEDRGKTYRAFVVELVRRVRDANPTCIFRRGSSPFIYFGSAALIAISLLALFAVFLTMGFGLTVTIVVKFLVIAVLAPVVYRWFKTSGPSRFSPDALLRGESVDDFLPTAK